MMPIQNQKPYFCPSEHCRFVRGALNAALYDLNSGHVYSLDREARDILELCCHGLDVTHISETVQTDTNETEAIRFLDQLVELGLGHYSTIPYQDVISLQPQPIIHIRKLWLEITSRCNLRCIHCYADADSHNPGAQLSLPVLRWLQVLTEAAQFSPPWVQLIGGEPLLCGKAFIQGILCHAQNLGIPHMEIFTNGILLNEAWADLFRDMNTHIAFSIYAKSAQVHDAVTGISGSHSRLLQNIEILIRKGVEVRPAFILMQENELEEQETLSWLSRQFGHETASADIIRCTPESRCSQGRHISPGLWKRKFRSHAVFTPVSDSLFYDHLTGHPCLNGSLCIHHNGDVFPCVMDRIRKLGSVLKMPLAEIVRNDPTTDVWHQNLDKIETCKDCEFRYACCDCRPEAAGINALLAGEIGYDFAAKNPCCLYDPHTGTWKGPDMRLSQLHTSS